MHKLFYVLLFLAYCSVCNAQSAYQIMRSVVKGNIQKRITICRTIKAPIEQSKLVADVLKTHKQTSIYSTICKNELKVTSQFTAPVLKRPETLYGSYKYLKILSLLSKEATYIDKQFAFIWKNINKTQSYNGVHHIVNKSTLKQIHHDMKMRARRDGEAFTINLAQLQNTAPGAFHIMHGNPKYNTVFHNQELQYKIYKKYGISGIIKNYFYEINKLNLEVGLKPIPGFVIQGTLKEAELWAKTFKLRWR